MSYNRGIFQSIRSVALGFVIMLYLSNGLFAQNFKYLNWTTEDGLPTNYVYGLMEDFDGYIWAFTENGIAKFDGYNWQVYNKRSGMPGNDVPLMSINPDSTMNVWVYPNDAALIRDGKIASVYNGVGKDFKMLQLGDAYFYAMPVELLVWKENELVHLDVYCEENDIDCQARISQVMRLQNSLIYVEDDHYISTEHKDTMLLVENVVRSGFVKLKEDYFYWAFNNRELTLHNTTTGSIYRIGGDVYIAPKHKVAAMQVENDKLIFVTSGGRFHFSRQLEEISRIDFTDLFHDIDVLRSIEDRNGNLWLGSRNSGVFCIPSRNKRTKLLHPNPNKCVIEGLAMTPEGRLYGASDNGELYVIDGDSLELVYHAESNGNFNYIDYSKYYNEIVYCQKVGCNEIIEDITGELVKGNKVSNFLRERAKNQERIPGVNSLGFYRNTLKFISISDGKGQYAVSRYISFYADKNGKKTTLRAYKDQNGFAYSDGLIVKSATHLYRYDRDLLVDSIAVPFHHTIGYIYEAKKNTYIVGTSSHGVYVVDYEHTDWNKIVDSDQVRKIIKYGSSIAVASYSGIYVLDENGVLLEHITTADGLPSNEIFDIVIDRDGLLLASTSDGLCRVLPMVDTAFEYRSTPLTINSIRVNGQSRDLTQKLDLEYDENNISISFGLLHFPSNGKIEYQYKLSPLQNEWSTTTDRKVRYYGLQNSKYSFDVKAIDIYGHQHCLKEPISINVKNTFWRSSWFWIISSLLIFGWFYGSYRRKLKEQKKQASKEIQINKRMAELELTALRSQMNPHFVFNALGAIQYYIQTHKVDEAEIYLTKFAMLMRKYLDFSRQKLITLNDEIKLLELYTMLESMRFEGLFEVKIEVDRDIDQYTAMMPSMIVQPFVENAVNHGLPQRLDGNGRLIIKFEKELTDILITVSDNGIGRRASLLYKRKGHVSHGMKIIKDKLEILNNSGITKITTTTSDLSDDEKYPGTSTIIRISEIS